MRFLKLMLLCILANATIINEAIAQITETKETSCTEKVPSIQIFSISDNKVQYNKADFAGFNEVKLSVFSRDLGESNKEINCYSLQDNFSRALASNGLWIVVIDGESNKQNLVFTEKCRDYFFKIEAICDGNTKFLSCANYFWADESCSGIVEDFTIHPQPASEFVYINNSTGRPIESINLLNLQGHKMYTKKNSALDKKFEIQLNGIVSGVHIVKIITSDKSTYYKKLIIQN